MKRSEERVTDEYLRRPEVTVGFAVVDDRGHPFPSTVGDTERAAMVNGLVSLFGQIVPASESDGSIKRRFKESCGTGGMKISAVLIESVDVVPDAVSAGGAESADGAHGQVGQEAGGGQPPQE